MHDQSHTVSRLAVHLPDEQKVYYREGNQKQAAARAEERDTQLTAWFKLNQTDENARKFLYCSLPEHYVFNKQTIKWTRRVRLNNIVTRMCSVSPRNEDNFYSRMLVLHAPGATTFSELKTVDGQIRTTFKAACVRLRLVENDNALHEALTEAAAHQMPQQLLTMFAMMCVFNQPVNALHLWNENKHFMIEDLLLRHDNITAENVALHYLNTLFEEHEMNCNMFGLPEPVGDYLGHEDVGNNDTDMSSLNIEQRQIFNAVVASARSVQRGEQTENKSFYVDAPGGSGKMYLFNKLYEYLNGNNIKTNTSAWTGIAATLLRGGKTLHSIFNLPVPLNETSVCNVPPNSGQGNFLKQVKVFIIDEASMILCYALKAIDKCLRDIMNTPTAFGGKVILLGEATSDKYFQLFLEPLLLLCLTCASNAQTCGTASIK
ncbi:uncharacterized protein LOC143024501 [Oratosquilla oratoria]|uniref:uncharacterized protein LOC143024501 n=1 Tax=Oratosquilla oratoria TaxID=337810 RepID=UPI003F76CC88